MDVDDDKENVVPRVAAPEPTELCSRELRVFLKTHFEIFDFFFFGIQLATSMDQSRMVAGKALAGSGREQDIERLKRLEEDPDPAFKRLQKFGRLQSENICIRLVDNFSTYLSEIVQVCLTKRPEILRSGETVRLDDILRFSNFRDLISFLVNRKVNELAYRNIADFEQFLLDRTGLVLTDSESDKVNLMFGIELRNIYSHNRGVVTETTIRRLSKIDHGRDVIIGKRFAADFDELVGIANSLVSIARDIDGRFSSKFKIQRRRYKKYGGG